MAQHSPAPAPPLPAEDGEANAGGAEPGQLFDTFPLINMGHDTCGTSDVLARHGVEGSETCSLY